MKKKNVDVIIRDAIDAALIGASKVSNKGEFFVVEVHGECSFVCDHFGTIDGPYKTVDAKTVAAKENEHYGFQTAV